MDFIKKRREEIIQREIYNKAAEGGINSAVYRGKIRESRKTVIIPSGFHLILRRCHLRLAENTFCNIFRNAKCGDLSFGADDPDTDISITGEGGAVLDGGVYNGLGERNSLKDGRPHISVKTIRWQNVERFEIAACAYQIKLMVAMIHRLSRGKNTRTSIFFRQHALARTGKKQYLRPRKKQL